MRSSTLRAALLAVAVLAAAPSLAQDGQRRGSQPAEPGNILSLLPPTTASRQQITVGGQKLAYVAEAGTLPIRDGNGAVTAQIFYTSYFPENTGATRPITFVFNGGPGAASGFLNLGAIGPRALVMTERGQIAPPPQKLADNPDSWLPFTDLVFVDPVSTGYSRAADTSKEGEFWSVRRDLDTMAAFIRLYLQKSDRMLSPVFLAGESYGGFRAAMLARTLQTDIGINPSGLVLISPALEMSLLRGNDFEPLPWALTLPALAAVNLDRQGISDQAALADRLKEVEHYAMTQYIAALAQPLADGGKAVSADVARFTGLPQALVERHFGRISASTYIKERERGSGQLLSRYDGAISSPDPNPSSSVPRGPDAVLDRSIPAWTSAMVAYLRDELGFKTDISYRLLNREVAGRWDYGRGGARQGYVGALDELEEARSHNPRMQVMIAQGYTDLVTPYPTASFLVGQMMPLAGAAPIEVKVYAGGHMMYMRPASRAALSRDAAALYARATGKAD
jgi:carboxypeptidase C (cathepsin A)